MLAVVAELDRLQPSRERDVLLADVAKNRRAGGERELNERSYLELSDRREPAGFRYLAQGRNVGRPNP